MQWLKGVAAKKPAKPWCLFISFVCPHFPLVAPPEFFNLYDLKKLPLPRLRDPADFPDHPVLRKLREVQNYEDHFRNEDHVRTALAAYYGMVSFLDDNIGRVLKTLSETGLDGDTLVVYTSDHGDNLGTRTFWGKSNMYEEAVGVPLILNGPGIPAGHHVATPVSLVDAYPTIIDAVGETATAEERKLPGTSLLKLLDGQDADRTVFSEYHAVGSMTGIFMVRFGRFKYVHYDGYRPQLLISTLIRWRRATSPSPVVTTQRLRKAKGGCATSATRPKSRRARSTIRSGASRNSAAPRPC